MGNKPGQQTDAQGNPIPGTGIGTTTARQDKDPLGLTGGWREVFDPLNLAPTVANALGLGEGGSKNKPPPEPPDFAKLAEDQTKADRPDINTPFSSQKWAQGPDGKWSLQTGLSPEVQRRFDALGDFDFGQFGTLGTGDDARKQATEAYYNDAASRLNPQFQNKQSDLIARLANQGIDQSSPQGQAALAELERSRMYAFGDAERGSQMEGRAAGKDVFQQNLLSRQQKISEALRKRGMPIEDMAMMRQFMDVPGFHRGADQLGAGQMQAQNAMNLWSTQQANQTDKTMGYLQLLMMLLGG